MRARIPPNAKPAVIKQQVTEEQLEAIINSRVAKRLAGYTQQSLVIYQLCEIIALHEYAGWSNKRINDYLIALSKVSKWYEKLLNSSVPCGGAPGDNLDLAVKHLTERAEEYRLRWQDLLGADLVGKCDPFKVRKGERSKK